MWVLRVNELRHGWIEHLCTDCLSTEPAQVVPAKPEKAGSEMIGKPCAKCWKPIDQ